MHTPRDCYESADNGQIYAIQINHHLTSPSQFIKQSWSLVKFDDYSIKSGLKISLKTGPKFFDYLVVP